jgi:hypothetical protein
MKKLLAIAALLIAFGLSVVAQAVAQRMTPEDQDRFDSYYTRWVQDKQSDNRDDMLHVEHRMQDLMSEYQIPPSTPYEEVAAQNAAPPRRDDRDYDRGYEGQWQGRLSADDQKDFNKEYAKWQEANAKKDQDDIDKHARKMEEIMARNNIPPNTPFDVIATANGNSVHYDYRQFQGKFSEDDQKDFDKAYEHWLKDRRKGDRDDVAKDEGKMQEIMARYDIPRDVPYDLLASGARGY